MEFLLDEINAVHIAVPDVWSELRTYTVIVKRTEFPHNYECEFGVKSQWFRWFWFQGSKLVSGGREWVRANKALASSH